MKQILPNIQIIAAPSNSKLFYFSRIYHSAINRGALNLIMNSVQSIASQKKHSKGKIIIHTWHDQDNLYCTMADDGPGIPAENRSRIFDPFFTTRMVGKGIGLGLNISYDIIVNKHKGMISFECPETGGTVFTLRFPLKC